jgi:hypothetical protein
MNPMLALYVIKQNEHKNVDKRDFFFSMYCPSQKSALGEIAATEQ